MILVLSCFSFIPFAMANESAAVPVPTLEKLRIAAEALYECGDDNNEIASDTYVYGNLKRSFYLEPVESGPNGMNLAKFVSKNVFFAQGAYTRHLSKERQSMLTQSFCRLLWAAQTKSMVFFEVTCDKSTRLPGDGEVIKAPAALGIMDGERLLILRGIARD
jgi:hypothetical protein